MSSDTPIGHMAHAMAAEAWTEQLARSDDPSVLLSDPMYRLQFCNGYLRGMAAVLEQQLEELRREQQQLLDDLDQDDNSPSL